jgi:hypothetical protein
MRNAPRFHAALLMFVLGTGACLATPPGSPLSELKGRQLSLGVFYDYSGQQLFQEGNPSVLHTMGAALELGLVPFVNVGIFGGGDLLNIDVPPGAAPSGGVTPRAFNSGFAPYGGLSAKLATPRFLQATTRFVAYGDAAFLRAKDDYNNERQGLFYNTGLTLQAEFDHRLNLVLGAEFYAIDGTQKNRGSSAETPMGLNAPDGLVDYFRGVVGFEYFFKGPNRPFISVAFRPTGSLKYQDGIGLQGASISVTLGAITNFGKQSDQPSEDEVHSLD